MVPERQTSPVATVSTEGRMLGCRGRGGEEEEIKKGTLKRLSPLWLYSDHRGEEVVNREREVVGSR
jgi:hypothetical protein